MNDTHPEIERLFDSLLRNKSGEERLLMAASMFDASRIMAVNSILEEYPEISPGILRAKLFKRSYGQDFALSTVDKIASRLEQTEE
ncbi:MAG: hypothetical protein HPY90_07980 [Syntrophothermus sp.]|uniref:hypothetical protein n=1 Tax=Syntrophothermus sp. TaxID=2736299 RepID=UPI00257B2447|nr:hypothetical protein [Syntrophothermus sp.]NSW83200.1 hypothetical protein [Syntrophothermus sp.]